MIRWFWVLIAAAALAACGEKWAETEHPAAGFAATFPMPVMSQPKDGGVLHYWARAGDVQLQVTRSRLPQDYSPATGPEEVLNAFSEGVRTEAGGRHESPPRLVTFQGRYPAIEFHMSGKLPDGRASFMKGRAVLAGDYMYMSSALWLPGEKNGPVHADRFLASFRITQ